ncbi:VanZ family protein [Agaribacterium sp. ZY112]|uniref:VanZ family protein n=1 Tax=Agaribacterium sp. ZY112 TaxID=3233574 RepID=UPI003523E8E8
MQTKLAFFHRPAIKFIRRAQLVIATLIYCVLLLLPSRSLQETVSLNDALLHGVGNFLLFCSLWLAFDAKPSRLFWLAFTIAFSGFMELMQGLGSRSPSWSDLGANAAGAFVALLVCTALDYYFSHLSNKKCA